VKLSTHEHCGGNSVLPIALRKEIESAIAKCSVIPARRAAPRIGAAIEGALTNAGWSGEVRLAGASGITITSAKLGVGLCLQTGNMSRMYADLLKLQQMFLKGSIKVGVMIVPGLLAAKEMGENIINADRLKRELDIFRSVIHMPLVVFAFDRQ
jgi:hypothetical protein